MKIMVHIQTGGVQRVTTLDYALSQQWNVEFVGMSGLPITSINALYNTTIIENGIRKIFIAGKVIQILTHNDVFLPEEYIRRLRCGDCIDHGQYKGTRKKGRSSILHKFESSP